MKLYFSNGSCSLCSMICLEEAGARYEGVRLNLREGEQRRPEFLKINPKGRVPALVLDDGTVITENPAVMSYIADTHPGAQLLAAPGEVARAKAQEWMAWCASSVHPAFGPLFGNRDDEAQRGKVQALLDHYEAWLRGPFVLGDRFSCADTYTLLFTFWAANFGLKAGEKMRRSARAILERPAVQRAVKTQQLKLENL